MRLQRNIDDKISAVRSTRPKILKSMNTRTHLATIATQAHR